MTVIFRARSHDGSFVTNPGVTNGLPNAAGVEGILPMDGKGKKKIENRGRTAQGLMQPDSPSQRLEWQKVLDLKQPDFPSSPWTEGRHMHDNRSQWWYLSRPMRLMKTSGRSADETWSEGGAKWWTLTSCWHSCLGVNDFYKRKSENRYVFGIAIFAIEKAKRTKDILDKKSPC